MSEEYFGEGEAAFEEEQSFSQIWMWIIVAAGAILVWYFFLQQIVFGNPMDDPPPPDWIPWLVWILVGVGMPALFFTLRLHVYVYRRHIYIRFRPFVSRRIHLSEIRSCAARTYRPIWEYGGWGIRWRPKRGWAYNVSGKEGVQLVLTNGKKILIGSGRAEELAVAIRKAMNT